MRFVSRRFRDLRDNWENSGIGYEVRRTAAAFVILVVLSCLVCLFRPDIQDKIIERILNMFSPGNVYTEDGGISAVGLFINNIQACFMSILYGILPYLYFPALSLGINAMVLGAMASYYISNGSLVLYLAGVLPHGVFELPALAISIACGLFLCRQISMWSPDKKDAVPLSSCVIRLVQVFLVCVTPLLAFGALTEAYVTPWIMSLFG